MKFGDIHSELAAPQTAFPDLYDFIERSTATLLELASEFDLQILIHGGYSGDFPRVIPFYQSLEAAQAAVLNRLDVGVLGSVQRDWPEEALFLFGALVAQWVVNRALVVARQDLFDLF